MIAVITWEQKQLLLCFWRMLLKDPSDFLILFSVLFFWRTTYSLKLHTYGKDSWNPIQQVQRWSFSRPVKLIFRTDHLRRGSVDPKHPRFDPAVMSPGVCDTTVSLFASPAVSQRDNLVMRSFWQKRMTIGKIILRERTWLQSYLTPPWRAPPAAWPSQ